MGVWDLSFQRGLGAELLVKGQGGGQTPPTPSVELKAFWQSRAEFSLKYFVFFNIFIMFTCCFKENCGRI